MFNGITISVRHQRTARQTMVKKSKKRNREKCFSEIKKAIILKYRCKVNTFF